MAADDGQAEYHTILLALIIFWLLILKNSRARPLWMGHGAMKRAGEVTQMYSGSFQHAAV